MCIGHRSYSDDTLQVTITIDWDEVVWGWEFIRMGQGSTAHSKVSLNFATEMDHRTMLIVGGWTAVPSKIVQVMYL